MEAEQLVAAGLGGVGALALVRVATRASASTAGISAEDAHRQTTGTLSVDPGRPLATCQTCGH